MCKPCIITAILFLLIATGVFFYLWNEAHAAEVGEVVINEIAWMGTENSPADEWIELYNTTNSDIDITGWGIYEDSGDTLIEPLEDIIKANSYYLIERTDDTTVPTVPASQEPTPWGGNGLINLPSGEHLTLEDAGNNIIDEVNAIEGWPAGNNDTKATMERTESGTWQTGPVGGTPKAQNSSTESESQEEPEPEPEPEPQEEPESTSELEPEPEPEPASEPEPEETQEEEQPETEEPSEPQFTKTKDVIISEFIPNPEGSDSENEWIELYNTGEGIIDISGWFLDDIEGGSKPFEFPNGTTVLPSEYRVFSIKLTKISLHNTQPDAVRLLYPDNSIADEVEYFEKADEGTSYALVAGNWTWTDNATPGYANQEPSPATSDKKQATKKSTATATKTGNINDDPSAGSAPKGGQAGQDSSDENSYTDNKTLTAEEFSAQIGGDNTGRGGFLPVILGIFIALIGGTGFLILYKKISQ
ncbi:MAG: lamin tail domain-containing protein [Candidatus Spechtbacterales bacterium]